MVMSMVTVKSNDFSNWVFPKCFAEFRDNFFFKKGLLYSNPGLLLERQRWYHSTIRTQVTERLIKLTLIHASVILSISLNSVKIWSILEKTPLIWNKNKFKWKCMTDMTACRSQFQPHKSVTQKSIEFFRIEFYRIYSIYRIRRICKICLLKVSLEPTTSHLKDRDDRSTTEPWRHR